MDRVMVKPQDIADRNEQSCRLCLTFPINPLICRHEFDPDIDPGLFDLETR
jgi:hypothetical protein